MIRGQNLHLSGTTFERKMSSTKRKPLLAHYTSISGVEKILLSNELWFANPLNMNDREEVGFGIEEGSRVVRQSAEIAEAVRVRCASDCFSPSFRSMLLEFCAKSRPRYLCLLPF